MADTTEGAGKEGKGDPVAPAGGGEAKPASAAAKPFSMASVSAPAAGAEGNIEMLMDVPLNVRVELGRTRMYVEDILRLGDGAVVELDKLAGDPVDVLVNDKLVAKGEILVLNENFCVRITEIVDPKERGKA